MRVDLKKIISDYPNTLNSRSQLSGIIKDLYPEENRDRNIVLAIYDLGIPMEMKNKTKIEDAKYRQLVKRIVDNYAIRESDAIDGLNMWLEAFEISFNDVGKSTFIVESTYKEESNPTRNEKEQLKLVKSGTTAYTKGKYTCIPYTVVINNPNSQYAIQYPKIRVVSEDEKGGIINVYEQTIGYVAANDTITYSSEAFYEGKMPHKISVSIAKIANNHFEKQDNERFLTQPLTEIKGMSYGFSGKDFKVKGLIKNISSRDVINVAVSVNYFKDNEPVGGYCNYLSDLFKNEEIPFDIYGSDGIKEFDAITISTVAWGI